MTPPRKPSAEECTAHARLDGAWRAIWFPQLGGYVGRAAVLPGESDGCFELCVWHDGEFPSDTCVMLHCCSAEQFVRFGETVLCMQGGTL